MRKNTKNSISREPSSSKNTLNELGTYGFEFNEDKSEGEEDDALYTQLQQSVDFGESIKPKNITFVSTEANSKLNSSLGKIDEEVYPLVFSSEAKNWEIKFNSQESKNEGFLMTVNGMKNHVAIGKTPYFSFKLCKLTQSSPGL